MTTTAFDLIVIGGGPAGYVGAIRAAQLGMSVLCIEKRPTLGGTCLNVGCIPSKALLESSHKYWEAREHLKDHGVVCKDITLDLNQLLGRKAKVVEDLTKGIDFLFKKNKITRVIGSATLKSNNSVLVGDQTYTGKKILLATGSVPQAPGFLEVDEDKVVSSTGALDFQKVPGHLVVIGGGYIGLEMGSVWSRLGSRVTVVEFADRIVPLMDEEVGHELHKVLAKQGLEFKLATKVQKVEKTAKSVNVTVEANKDGSIEILSCDKVLVCTGRKPYTEGLGLMELGIELDVQGRIPVNHSYETACSGIYAVGDVIPGPMLAHKAEEEAVAAVEFMAGQRPHVNYSAIPAVIFTFPEVATVGQTEEELKAENRPYTVGKFPFSANSRARATGETTGFVKILADPVSDEVLGVHIIGPHAGAMIAEAVLAMEYKAASEDIARTCHAHPTLSEAVKEAALAVLKRAIHV